MEFQFGETSVAVNALDRAGLERILAERFAAGEGAALATINLDHIVKLRQDKAFQKAYAAQDIVVADGWPIVWLSKIARRPVEKIPGSELVLPLSVLAARNDVHAALIGSHAQALQDAARVLEREAPGLQVAYQNAPPMGFDANSDLADELLKGVSDSGARLCFLALGAPRQELLAMRGRVLAPDVVFASIGAGLDFLGGHQKRAPVWVQTIGMEWLWRALGSPLRLGPRYLKCLAVLPGLVWEARRQRRH